jgi:hypothetical protein
MGTYHVELSGKLSLADQAQAINGEEALGTKFLGSRIWVNKKDLLTNLAEFEELDEEPDPPLGPVALSKTLPSGKTPVWAGPMLVQGSAVSQVFVTR